jgi:hypothetical protein
LISWPIWTSTNSSRALPSQTHPDRGHPSLMADGPHRLAPHKRRWGPAAQITKLTREQASGMEGQKSARVASALPDQSWIRDITGTVLMQYLELRQRLQQCSVQSGVPDCFVWKWCSSGTYSSASAYRALFIGQLATLGAKELWRSRTPNNSLLCMACHPQTLEG